MGMFRMGSIMGLTKKAMGDTDKKGREGITWLEVKYQWHKYN